MVQELVQFGELLVAVANVLAGVCQREHRLAAELLAGVDQLLEVLLAGDAPFAALVGVVGHQAAGLDAVLGDLVQCAVPHRGGDFVDELQERGDGGGGAASQAAVRDAGLGGLPQGSAVAAGDVPQRLHGDAADPPGRRVHHALEGDVRMALAHQAHVR